MNLAHHSSLRSIGLYTLLMNIRSPKFKASDLLKHVSESPQYIGYTLDELVAEGKITKDGEYYSVNDSTEPYSELGDLERRIYELFGISKSYSVVAWFLGKLDKTFELDSELAERVRLEYDAASVVQFWDPHNREQAFKRALVDKSLGNVTLEDLRQLLIKKDKGELVWVT